MPFPSYRSPTHTSVSVSNTTSTTVLAANLNNVRYRNFRNPRGNSATIWLALTSAAAVGGPALIDLAPGEYYEMSERLGNLFDGQVNAINDGSANQSLLVTEGL